jgi:stearoyl-CoA desaturase (delta-9 desaturase)
MSFALDKLNCQNASVREPGPGSESGTRPNGKSVGVTKKKQHISETSVTWTNWHKHANWLNIIFIVGIPVAGLVSTAWVPLRLPTAIWAAVYYFLTGLGITAGYHRLWSHTSYSARLPLQIFLAALGGGAVQGSIQWWSRGHRAHHRYTDTDKDPYSVNKGILYAHFGWYVTGHRNPT